MRGVGTRGQGQENVCRLLLQDTQLSEVKAAGTADGISSEKSLRNSL